MRHNLPALRQHILILAFLPGIIVALIMGGLYLGKRYVEFDDQLMFEALDQSWRKAGAAELLLRKNQQEELQQLMTILLEDMNIRAVSLLDNHGNTSAHTGPSLTNDSGVFTLLHTEQRFFQNSDIIQVATPIVNPNNGEQRGWLVIDFTYAQTYLKLYHSLAFGIVVVAMG